MKHTFKTISAVAVFLTIIAVFCACEISFGEQETTTLPSLAELEEPTQSKTEYKKPTETSTTTTVKKIEIDSLETILHNIKDFPSGTAGSTTKGYLIAYKLLNFTQNSNFTIDEVRQDYQFFLDSLDETEKLIYEENLPEIDYYARNIIDNPDVLKEHIEKYDDISKDGKISLSNYEALYVIISK